jgi:signal transduction histidine kinase/ActR/RegA family two-component response regulator
MPPNSEESSINFFQRLLQFDNERLLAEQVNLVLTVESKGLLFSTIIAITVYWFLFSSTNKLHLTFWIIAILASSLISSRLMFLYLAKKKFNQIKCTYFLMVSNAALGLSWGSLAWIAVDGVSVFSSIVVIALLVSLLVGLMSTLSPILSLYVIACLTISGTVSSKLLSLNQSEYNNIGLFGIAACVIFIAMARDMNQQHKKNILLQFDNQDLIEKLNQETEKVRAAQKLAENESQAKTKFLAAASHDIRQPIHALGLFLEVLARSPLTQYQQQVLQNANTAFEASAEMLNTLLDFSRVEAGVVDVQQRAIYLQPMLNKLESEMAPLAANKNLVYRSKDTEAIVNSDPALLELILRNLISNAIRYTERGGILIACRQRGVYTSLEIWDTGIGIAPVHHDNIFKEFYQLGNTERDRKKGLGLGLAIVRGYTQMLKHNLLFNSALGRGSVFKVEIFNAIEKPKNNSATAKQPQLTSLNARVLVIDDDETVRLGMAGLLHTWGCQCDAADSIEEALQFVKNQTPDLIISDFRLRDLQTGAQAIAQIHTACGTTIPALLITGDTGKDRLIEATQSGIPLLSKPVAPSVLYAKLCELLADKDYLRQQPINSTVKENQ